MVFSLRGRAGADWQPDQNKGNNSRIQGFMDSRKIVAHDSENASRDKAMIAAVMKQV